MEPTVTRYPPAAQAPAPSVLRPASRLQSLSTRDLVAELVQKANLLARKEIELGKSEIRKDLRAEIQMAGGLGIAGLCGILTLAMMLVALAFALQEGGVLAGWLASLIIAGVVLAVGTAAGLIGWARRSRSPLQATRKTLQDDLRWAKERMT